MKKNTEKTYRLASAPMLYTPGLIKWAMAYYRTSPRKAAKLIADGYPGVSSAIAARLLAGKIPFTVEGDTVIFTA